MGWYNEWDKQEPTETPSKMSTTELKMSRQVLLSLEECRDSAPEVCMGKTLMKTAYTVGVGGTHALKAPRKEDLTESENQETPELDEYECSIHGIRRSRTDIYKDTKGEYFCKEINRCWVTRATAGKEPPGLEMYYPAKYHPLESRKGGRQQGQRA